VPASFTADGIGGVQHSDGSSATATGDGAAVAA